MKINLKIIYFLIIILLLNEVCVSYAFQKTNQGNKNQISIVYVDDDFNSSTPGWGYDHFDNIQDAVDNVSDSGTVNVYNGFYDVFKVENRSNIEITSIETIEPIINGNQYSYDESFSPPILIKCVILIYNSINIELKKLNIQGNNLDGRSYAIFYNDSTGNIFDCTISSNQKGNMNSLGIRAQCNSLVTVENSTIENYGRIGIYCKTGTTLNVYNNTIIGQIYTTSDGDFVSYGIEVEDLESASSATIKYNHIYNHNYIGNPSWSSAGILIDNWRYYQVTPDMSSAIVEYNSIYDNMIGLQIVPNENIHVNYNKIYNNSDYGAISDPYWDGTSYVYEDLDAINNWWGDQTGPYNPSSNPDGLGNEITDNILYEPWLENYLPKIQITNPKSGFLYFNFKDILVFKIPFIITLIIGKIDLEADVSVGLFDIDKVEFYIDDVLKFTDTTVPYKWTWNEVAPFFSYTIKTIVYDVSGYRSSDVLRVWKSQYILG